MLIKYQKDIAEHLGVTPALVCWWFKGKFKPHIRNQEKLKKFGFEDASIWGDENKIRDYVEKMGISDEVFLHISAKRKKAKLSKN